MDTTGGAIIAQMLKQEGVEKFLGIVDGTYTQLSICRSPASRFRFLI